MGARATARACVIRGIDMIVTALMGSCFFAAVVAMLSVPWMAGVEARLRRSMGITEV